jgi:hypothetical protein
VTINQQNYRR